MATIQIELSKQAFKELVKHVFIGNWVLSANVSGKNEESEDLMDRVLSVAKNYNVVREIEYDEHLNGYFLTADKEEEFIEDIEDYDDDTFWETLIERLALRDFGQKFGEGSFETMEREKALKIINEMENNYREEFSKHGIKNLILAGRDNS